MPCRRCLLVVGVPAILVTLTGASRSAVILTLVPKSRSLSRKVILSFWGSCWYGRTLSTMPVDRMHLMSTWSPGMMALAGIRIMAVASICFLSIWLLVGVLLGACLMTALCATGLSTPFYLMRGSLLSVVHEPQNGAVTT